jgi:tRNA-splicing ligase RtcB
MELQRISDFSWRIPRQGDMRVDGIVYSTREMLAAAKYDESLTQVMNVACLPGIVGASLAMPDIHWGYGFPIGGVAAFDPDDGVISPGGVGYDINCGVRLLRTDLEADAMRPKIEALVNGLFRDVPTGVGSRRSDLRLNDKDMDGVLAGGAGWSVKRGFGSEEDLRFIEASGCVPGADPGFVSHRAKERGHDQLGTLGSGNHFVEVEEVVEIFDEGAAHAMGLFAGQVVITIHTGSRGLGHQVCDDSIDIMLKASRKYGIDLPDKQLCCAPIASEEGKKYFAAMAAAANFAFANRQIIMHFVRESIEKTLGMPPRDVRLSPVYDVAHNIAKFEEHMVGGVSRRLCVHRKGATRAFPAGHPEVPAAYRKIGQPVLIPGDMGRYSFVLVGTKKAMDETFGSSCHGAGRLMSRQSAKKAVRGHDVGRELEAEGIIVRGASYATVAEEAPLAYKDVADVVDCVANAGIARKVAKLRPMGVIKG